MWHETVILAFTRNFSIFVAKKDVWLVISTKWNCQPWQGTYIKWTLLFFSHSRHFPFHFTHLLCRSSSSSFCCRLLSASFRSLSRFMVSSSNRSIFLPRSILSSLSGGWYITRVTDTKPPAVRSYGNRDTLHQSKRTWICALTNPNTEKWVGGISLHSGYACFCSCL